MRVWGWGWVLLAAATPMACAGADDASGGGYDPHGGQTGSLQPCSAPAHSQPVPTGDAALVFHTGCSTEGELALSDANGAPVTFELEEIDEGVVLLRTEGVLAPGEYTVETPTGTQTFTVSESEPLPLRLGMLSRSVGDCSRAFALVFDPAVLPYRPLLKLSYSIDGGPDTTWFEYGTLEPTQTTVELALPALARGAHELEVRAAIAGETAAPNPVTLAFEYDCASGDTGTMACTLPRGAAPAGASGFTAGASQLTALLFFLGGLGGLWRRRVK